MNIVPSLLWVKRGVLQSTPTEIKIEPEEITSLDGIAVYANQREDPNMQGDGEDDSDNEDFSITERDNMVVAVKMEAKDDESTLICYLYNHDEKDFYVHHHYDLQNPAIALEMINYDPGVESGKGNLVAVGSMDNSISIWDLDVIGPVPTFVLGEVDPEGKNNEARVGHDDSVLSLAWSPLAPRVLASGGADKKVYLWDLDTHELNTTVTLISDAAQSLKWHPTETALLLAGTCSGTVEIVDLVNNEHRSVASWNFGDSGEVNSVCWDPHNTDCIYVASEDGKVRYVDRRKPGEVVWVVDAHETHAQSIAVNTIVESMVATCGGESVKIWKKSAEGLVLAHEEKLNMGELMTVQFNPDVAESLVVGGSCEEMLKVLDVSKMSGVTQAFN